jgi:Protein of unknown function (DUF3016)
MKMRISVLLSAALSLASLGHAASAKANDNAARVEVLFEQPENFTDIKDSSMGSERGRQAYLDSFREYLQENLAPRLREGHKISITFTDIDLAGDFEPWRGASAQDVRIVKDIYVPRLKFNYVVTDAQGQIVKDGKANLADLNFQMNISTPASSSDPLRYEKHMLDDWMRSELGSKTKKK